MTKQIEGRGARSPVVVFVALVALVAAITAGVLLTREPAPPPPEPPPEVFPDPTPDRTLTDEEAIARFKELDALRMEALEERETALLSEVFASESPAGRRLKRSIKTLRRERAFADEQREILSLAVIRNTPTEVIIRQVSLLDVRFTDRAGRDITRTGGLERQRTRWSLRLDGTQWLLYEGTIQSARAAK